MLSHLDQQSIPAREAWFPENSRDSQSVRCSGDVTGHARTAGSQEPSRTANSILLICARRNSVSPVNAVAHQDCHVLGAFKILKS